jgi:hypothetical protein
MLIKEPLAKVVIPVKTGIQKGHNYLKRLDSCLRRNDKNPFLRTFARGSKTRNLMAALLAAILIFALMAGSEARVTGVCVNCHTMHNSQGGAAVNTANAGAPQDFLLVNKGTGTVTACWGCHAQTTALNILTNIPQLRHTNATDLAGGNFAWITSTKTPLATGATTSNAGHNVSDTGIAEATLTVIPGDEFSNPNILVPGTAGTTRLTCAGTTGCHGDRAVAGVASMKGAHHANDAVLKFGTINDASQGTTVGNSYRFLKGVKGGEETNWQGVSPSATVHNEYRGTTGTGLESTISSPGSNTISGLCAECHGNYHGPGAGDLDSPSPWLRHPTDIILPNTGEYASYTAYNLTAPVARQTIPNAISGTVTPGTDVIMCLSCHRAHASANFKMTRWNYKSNPLSGGTLAEAISGCNVCHTSKN